MIRSILSNTRMQKFLLLFSNPSSANINTKVYLSQRLKANCDNYYLKYQKYFPRQKIRDYADMYTNLYKCFPPGTHFVLTMENYNTNANYVTTATDTVAQVAPEPPSYALFKRFIGGITLKKFQLKESVYLNGTNISDDDFGLELEFESINVNSYPVTRTSTSLAEAMELFAYIYSI